MTAADVLYLECLYCTRRAAPGSDWCCDWCYDAGPATHQPPEHTKACEARRRRAIDREYDHA